jgi:DeoR/GlpR family transcriptional regulator of sugar metabolism
MGRNSFALFAPLDRVDAIVTDSIREDDRKRLEESGVEVIATD